MTRLVVDSEFWGKLNHLGGPVEFCDEAGHTLGYFHPAVTTGEGEGIPASLISEEELQRRREQRGGRSLEAILADLEKR
jgi:hypothetical protein